MPASIRDAWLSGLVLSTLVVAACAMPSTAPSTTSAPPAHAHVPGDHNHAKGKMPMATDGTYDALLTAHLSAKDGNEPDIFVENKDGPFALRAITMEATARGAASQHTASFACTPANERPAGETSGTCSHFVAKAPWLRVGELLRVEAMLPADKPVLMTWRDFEARTYAHHEE